MARPPRTNQLVAGAPNHIIVRGNNRRRLFSHRRDYLRYIELLAKALQATNCLLYAACLMANHIHLLLNPPTVAAASLLMQRVNQRYAQVRNRVTGGSGKLFEARFVSRPIKDDEHLALCVMYIDANPFRARVRGCERYQWSTHSLHCRGQRTKPLDDLVTFDGWYLGLGATPQERADHYRDCFENYRAAHRPEEEPLAGEAPAPTRNRLQRPDGSSAR